MRIGRKTTPPPGMVGRLMRRAFRADGPSTRPASTWNPEWGEAPPPAEVERARAWAAEMRHEPANDLCTPEMAVRFLQEKIDPRALYLTDRDMLIILCAFAHGNHNYLAQSLSQFGDKFFAEVLRHLFSKEVAEKYGYSLAYPAESAMRLMYSFGLCEAEPVSAFLKDHDLVGCFLTCAGALKLEAVDVQGFMRSFFVMADLLQAGAEPATPVHIGPPAILHDFWGTVGEAKGPQLTKVFLETVPEAERATVLTYWVQEDAGPAGQVISNAVGHHAEISKAVNAMPRTAAAELVAAELKKVPDDLAADPAKARAYRETDNFGALKCCFELRTTETGAGVNISPVWDALTPEGKAEFFRVFRIYCLTVREMFTELLPPALARKVRALPPEELAEIRKTSRPEVAVFLKERGIVDFEQARPAVESPVEPLVEPQAWSPDFGREPEIGPKVADFAQGHAGHFSEIWGETRYAGFAQRAFTKTFAPEERAAAFRALWKADPALASLIIRSIKFHIVAGEMLSGLNDAHLVHVFESSLVQPPSFEASTVAMYDDLDGEALCRGLCQLPHERIAAVVNGVNDKTLAGLLDQAYLVAMGKLDERRTRGYVNGTMAEVLQSGKVDREKVARAVTATQPETAEWVKQIYQGKLDVLTARAEAEKQFTDDPLAKELRTAAMSAAKIEGIFSAITPLAATLGEQFDRAKSITAAIERKDAGSLWDAVEDIEAVASLLGKKELLNSREFYLVRLAAEKVCDWLAAQIFEGLIPIPLINVDGGTVTARLVVVDEYSEDRLLAVLRSLHPFDIVVCRNFPTNYPATAPVAGIITSHGGGPYDHDTMRARQLGVPIGKLPGATRLLRHFHGQWVTLTLGERNELRLADDPEEAAAHRNFGLLEVKKKQTLGPKAEKLKLMAERGYQVPPAEFINSSLDYRLYELLGFYESIPKILGPHPLAGGERSVREKLEKIRRLFIEAQAPREVVDVLLELNARLPGIARIFRPSIPFEDLPNFAAAGFMESPVSTTQEAAVVAAMLAGWASYWNELPFMARVQHGLGHFDYLPGAALMQLIIARAAGNMIVSEQEVLISAVHGQGQGAMTEKIEPDVIRVDRGSRKVTVQPAKVRNRMMVFSDGRLVSVELADGLKDQPAISEDEAQALAKQGEALHRDYGPQPRDVEWVIDQSSGLWIVQDRGYGG